MKLSEIKKHLANTETVNFKLLSGAYVPEHFHVTEIGLVNKHYIDCGGTERFEHLVNFQLWNASDVEHRLKPQKLLKIIDLSQKVLGMEDLEIEVEYQTGTIGKYGLRFDGSDFILEPKLAACLASESCGVPAEKQQLQLTELVNQTGCCTPGGCCC